MKTLIALFLICLVCACPAQYSSNISEYRVYVYNTHEEIPPTYTHPADTNRFGVAWERGDGTNLEGFEIPATWEEIYLHVVPNTPDMWDGGTANAPFVISLSEGTYAFTITEVDIGNWESGKGTPFYIKAIEVYAKVPFNFQIPEPEQ